MEANTKPNNPAAFPQNTYECNCGDGSAPVVVTDPNNPGMTLRDYFAAAVLPNYSLETTADNAARISYEYADAMLKERGKC